MKRKVDTMVQGFRTTDGAGVKLVRVLGIKTTDKYDPILMLDSFDSEKPEDYIAGFPNHPHRGIETISYLSSGQMTHKDSMGNEDTIKDGEIQWMTAGSGIIHSESLPPSKKLLGVQLWLNLPKDKKMVKPNYHAVKYDEIEEIEIPGGKLRLLAGKYLDHQGYKSEYLPLDYYDIHLAQGEKFKIQVEENKSITLFTLVGSIKVEGQEVEEKTAAKLTKGTELEIEAMDDSQILFISSDELKEPISWGGPIVMNTKEELDLAFEELKTGKFIKEEVDY